MTIANQSLQTAGAFNVQVGSQTQRVQFLTFNASVTLWFEGYATPTSVVVDPQNEVIESNEADNVFSGPLPIPTPVPTCTPTQPPTDTPPTPTPTLAPTQTPVPTNTATQVPTATAVATATPTPTNACQRFEPNDTPSQAGSITVGAIQTHGLCRNSDVDWIRVQLTRNVRYRIATVDTRTGTNSQFTVYGPAGIVARSIDNVSGATRTFRAATSGTYFIRVSKGSGSSNQADAYQISVRPVQALNAGAQLDGMFDMHLPPMFSDAAQ